MADEVEAAFQFGPLQGVALALCELLAATVSKRYAALRWPQRFIDERLPPIAEVALAASALAELRHEQRAVGVEALKRVVRRWLRPDD